MKQLDMLGVPPDTALPLTPQGRAEKKRVNVPRTSVEVYREHVDAKGRAAAVLEWLSAPVIHQFQPPTSAEVAAWRLHVTQRTKRGWSADERMACLLYVRRGLSDLKEHGAVEHGPKRKCRVSGLTCVTWKVVSR